ncbi:hypothetical protein KIL84_012646 [Mauremys mutica]|uniref:Uncharacterized protein n=1 Tax=Mauremys mutica TaxID=74926 RepID=A0A9D3XT27_9SAUR|nr:hypothetical protein KIL84_012646 [Mauremys mutica]
MPGTKNSPTPLLPPRFDFSVSGDMGRHGFCRQMGPSAPVSSPALPSQAPSLQGAHASVLPCTLRRLKWVENEACVSRVANVSDPLLSKTSGRNAPTQPGLHREP